MRYAFCAALLAVVTTACSGGVPTAAVPDAAAGRPSQLSSTYTSAPAGAPLYVSLSPPGQKGHHQPGVVSVYQDRGTSRPAHVYDIRPANAGATALDPAGHVYVAQSTGTNTSNILEYTPWGHTQLRSIPLQYSVSSLAFDAAGNLYVDAWTFSPSETFAILVFPPGATTPSETIDTEPYFGMFVNHKGDVFVQRNVGIVNGHNRVQTAVYLAGQTAVSYTFTIDAEQPPFAVDSHDNTYIGTAFGIKVYPEGESTPSKTFDGEGWTANALAFDASDNLFVAEHDDSIKLIPSGHTKATSVIPSPAGDSGRIIGLSTDPFGNVFSLILEPSFENKLIEYRGTNELGSYDFLYDAGQLMVGETHK